MLVRQIRDELLSSQDTVCLQRARLATEGYRRFEGDPVPLKRAKTFAHILQHMDLDLASNPIFAGNTSSRPRAWMLIPEYGFEGDSQMEIEIPRLRGFLEDKIPDDLRSFWAGRSFGGACGIGHLAVDMARVVHQGLESVIAEVKCYEGDASAAQRTYREAMRIALQAVVGWAGRYADEAERAAQAAADPVIRAMHRRVAEACRQVPAKPARNLFEGLQSIILTHLAIAVEGHGYSISIGLPDRVLAPFITDDLDYEEVVGLVSAFLLKIAANSFLGSGTKTQGITIGGADHLGRDQCNLATRAVLDGCDRIRVGDPTVYLRWHEGLPSAIKNRAAEMLASGFSMPILVNDAPTVRGIMDLGIAAEDAWDYCIIGCNELGIPGRLAISASPVIGGTVRYLEILNQTLLEHPDLGEVRDMSDLLTAMEERMARRAMQMRQQGVRQQQRMAERAPTPFTSSLMQGCIDRGQDFCVGMDNIRPGVYERSLTNAVNALAAIDRVVFKRRVLTLAEVKAALESDFADPAVRGHLLQAPKWGNDDDRADRWAAELVEMRERVLEAVNARFGDTPHAVCHVVRSLHYVDGRCLGASPDGRPAGAPVADSIGAQAGTAVEGPTAVLNSVLKLDAARYYRGGYNLNITLQHSSATSDTVLGLVEGFFAQGGQELQLNCLNAETLRDALVQPERYPDLVVRVAGFCARFIDLPPLQQQEIIARAEA